VAQGCANSPSRARVDPEHEWGTPTPKIASKNWHLEKKNFFHPKTPNVGTFVGGSFYSWTSLAKNLKKKIGQKVHE